MVGFVLQTLQLLIEVQHKTFGEGKRTLAISADQLAHCSADGEARELEDSWVKQIYDTLVECATTVVPFLHVALKHDEAIPGTKDLESFLAEKKGALHNPNARLEIIGGNHFFAAALLVRFFAHVALILYF